MSPQVITKHPKEGTINTVLFEALKQVSILLPIPGYTASDGLLCIPLSLCEPDDSTLHHAYYDISTEQEELANPIGYPLDKWTLHEGIELIEHQGVEFITIAALICIKAEQAGMDQEFSTYLSTIATLYATLANATLNTNEGNLYYD